MFLIIYPSVGQNEEYLLLLVFAKFITYLYRIQPSLQKNQVTVQI